MTDTAQAIAKDCLNAAYSNTKSFPEIVGVLIQNGFESYRIDYMRQIASYFLSDGSSFDLPLDKHDVTVAKTFDVDTVKAAIKQAQQNLDGYTYKGFCEKVMHAGCAAYIVSFLGKRVLYYGRTAETHVELFPQSATDR